MTSDFNSPDNGEKIHVNSYTKKDGTDVSSYYRSRPGQGGFLPEPDKSYLDNPLIMQGFQEKVVPVISYPFEWAGVQVASPEYIYQTGEEFAKKTRFR